MDYDETEFPFDDNGNPRQVRDGAFVVSHGTVLIPFLVKRCLQGLLVPDRRQAKVLSLDRCLPR